MASSDRADRSPRALKTEDSELLIKCLKEKKIHITRTPTPLIKRVYRLYKSGKYRVETRLNPITKEEKEHLVYHSDVNGYVIVPLESEVSTIIEHFSKKHKGENRIKLHNRIKTIYTGISGLRIQEWINNNNEEHHDIKEPEHIKAESTASAPMETLQIDLIDFTSSKSKFGEKTYSYVLIVVDVFSRFLFLSPLVDKEPVEIETVLKEFFQMFGRPTCIHTVHESVFKENVRTALNLLGMNKHENYTSTTKKQKMELRHHGNLKSKVKSDLLQEKKSDQWSENLKTYMEVYNTATREKLGNLSPFQVFYGRNPNYGEVSIIDDVNNHDDNDDVSCEMKNYLQKCTTFREKAAENIILDSKRSLPSAQYDIDEKVRVNDIIGVIKARNEDQYQIEYEINKKKEVSWYPVNQITLLSEDGENKEKQPSKLLKESNIFKTSYHLGITDKSSKTNQNVKDDTQKNVKQNENKISCANKKDEPMISPRTTKEKAQNEISVEKDKNSKEAKKSCVNKKDEPMISPRATKGKAQNEISVEKDKNSKEAKKSCVNKKDEPMISPRATKEKAENEISVKKNDKVKKVNKQINENRVDKGKRDDEVARTSQSQKRKSVRKTRISNQLKLNQLIKKENQHVINTLQLNTLMSGRGLRTVEVTRDENCFFRVISHQLYGDRCLYKKVRARALQHVINNIDIFQNVIEDRNVDEFISSLSTDGIWPDKLAQQAVSDAYGITLEIIKSNKQKYDTNIIHPRGKRTSSRLFVIIHIRLLDYLSTEIDLPFQTLSKSYITNNKFQPITCPLDGPLSWFMLSLAFFPKLLDLVKQYHLAEFVRAFELFKAEKQYEGKLYWLNNVARLPLSSKNNNFETEQFFEPFARTDLVKLQIETTCSNEQCSEKRIRTQHISVKQNDESFLTRIESATSIIDKEFCSKCCVVESITNLMLPPFVLISKDFITDDDDIPTLLTLHDIAFVLLLITSYEKNKHNTSIFRFNGKFWIKYDSSKKKKEKMISIPEVQLINIEYLVYGRSDLLNENDVFSNEFLPTLPYTIEFDSDDDSNELTDQPESKKMKK